ncbi:MAG: NUMOD4 domain-containing protein [Cyclobacteriaceae bacterium]
MRKKAKAEKWKKISFPEGFNSIANYEISNYGRVRNMQSDGSSHVKKPIFQNGQVVYKFTFPEKHNDGQRLILHQKASHLVAKHFFKRTYFKGCYVVWEDYNRLNNHESNLKILNESEGRHHIALGRYHYKNVVQKLIEPPDDDSLLEEDENRFKRVEYDDDYFKPIDYLPNYEISRHGVIRRKVPPFQGKVIKPRLHPSGFLFCDLKYKNKRYTVYPHKEVARHWNINVKPTERTIVSHIDGDLTNNSSDNLEWTTAKESANITKSHNKINYKKIWEKRRNLYGKTGRAKKDNS